MHDDAPAIENLLMSHTGHAVEPGVEVNLPAEQTTGNADVVAQNEPTGHVVQPDAAAVEYWPEVQAVHVVAAERENRPAGQGVIDVVLEQANPAGQVVHVEDVVINIIVPVPQVGTELTLYVHCPVPMFNKALLVETLTIVTPAT
jgi:hypothetical protein